MSKEKCCGKWKKKGNYCKHCPLIEKQNNQKKIEKKEKEMRLEKQLEFIIEIDQLKHIVRRNLLADGKRRENDSEHSWHLALMVLVLSEHSNAKNLNLLKVMKMVLIHDLVEIDAGDTYAYDEKGHEDKRERELKAADRIFNILPKDQAKELFDLWEEFEAKETEEAKFAAMVDRLQPILLNYASGGISWKEHQISKQMVIKRNQHAKNGSKTVWKRIKKLINEATAKGYLIDEENDNDNNH